MSLQGNHPSSDRRPCEQVMQFRLKALKSLNTSIFNAERIKSLEDGRDE